MILAEILATPVSAYLMTYDAAMPYALGLVIIVVGMIPAIFLPETLAFAKARKSAQLHATPTDSSGTEVPGKHEALQDLIRRAREFKNSTKFIWRDKNVCLLVVILLVSVMSRQSTNILLQYASKKFNWSIARVSAAGTTHELS